MKQLLLDIKPAPAPTLQNFVTGINSETLHTLNAILNGLETAKFIYLWGETGSGKSHLLQAMQAAGIDVADDVHLLDESAQIALFNRFNDLKETGKPLICAGLHAPAQMGLRDDLATRLAWGLVYHLQPLSDAEKALALNHHATERGMKLPAEVIDYCLRHLRRDLPTLMSTLNALDEWSLITKKPVTVPMLKQLIQLPLELP